MVWEALVAPEALPALKSSFEVISARLTGEGVCARVLCEAGPPGDDFAPAEPSLEDYYFSLVSRARGA